MEGGVWGPVSLWYHPHHRDAAPARNTTVTATMVTVTTVTATMVTATTVTAYVASFPGLSGLGMRLLFMILR